MNRRRLVLTKVVLEQENTAAALLVKVDGAWAPLEFLSASGSRTGALNLVIEPGETVSFMVRRESFFGPTVQVSTGDDPFGGTPTGGVVRLHLYGNLEEVAGGDGTPEAKRRRIASAAAAAGA